MKSATYTQIVGFMLRARREERGVSLEKFAKTMRMSGSGWSRVETGDSTVTVVQLLQATRALNTSPTGLLSAVDNVLARLTALGVTVHDVRPSKGRILTMGTLSAMLLRSQFA